MNPLNLIRRRDIAPAYSLRARIGRTLSLPRFLRASRSISLGSNPYVRATISTSWIGDWTVKIHFGRGAGYIHGATAWIGSAVGPAGVRAYYPAFSMGITRNGNRAPWTRH